MIINYDSKMFIVHATNKGAGFCSDHPVTAPHLLVKSHLTV
jgi:hypothetical protein